MHGPLPAVRDSAETANYMNPASGDNKELLELARQGDADAFALLFERYRELISRIAFRLVGSGACDDVVMETCLKTWQSLPEYQSEAALKKWWCRLVHNCALDELRRRKRRRDDTVSADEEDAQPLIEQVADSHAESPADAAVHRELGLLLEKAMAKLSPEHRTTLLLREVDGLEYSQIAAATGVSIGTVMSRLFNARRRLRRLISEEHADEEAILATHS